MPEFDTGERVAPVLDFPSRDGLAVHAVRVDYDARRVHAAVRTGIRPAPTSTSSTAA